MIQSWHLKALVLAEVTVVSMCVGLAVWLWRFSADDFRSRPVPAWKPHELFTPEAAPLINDKVEFGAALQRPLLRQMRRPFVAAAVPAPTMVPPPVIQAPEPVVVHPSAVDPHQLSVKGLIFTNKIKKALMTSPEAPEGEWYDEGANVSGWSLDVIRKDKVILKSGAEYAELPLYVDNISNPVGSPP